MQKIGCLTAILILALAARAQDDSTDTEALRRMINLSEVVVRSDLDINRFIRYVKEDTTFYKAFKNLRILGYTSLNDIRMYSKKGKVQAMLQSRTRQNVSGGCRTMDVLEERTTGDMRDRRGDLNYYTAGLYAGLFFTEGKVCGETNIVKGTSFSTKSRKGLEKHKEQLKMLFFDPGKKIPGIPFMGDKGNIFDPSIAQYYDFKIDLGDYENQYCYIFSVTARKDLAASEKDKIVFNNMVTWFNAKTMEIVGRNYDLSYDAGVYSFDVQMEVLMTRFGQYLVPRVLRYNGSWNVVFRKKEKGIFTATLFDFQEE